MDLLDLDALDKGLHTCAQLTGEGDIVRAVNRQHGIAVIVVQNMRTHHAFVSPRIAELYLFIDNAVSGIFLGEGIDILTAAGHFGGVHVARTLTAVHILTAYLRQRVLVIGQLYGISSGE